MPFSFDSTLSSIKSYYDPDVRDAHLNTLAYVAIDEEGNVFVTREHDELHYRRTYNFNLFDGSEETWKYVIGSENVDAMLAIKAVFKSKLVPFFESGGNGNFIFNMDVSRSDIWQSESGHGLSASFKAALNLAYDNAVAPAEDGAFIMGDAIKLPNLGGSEILIRQDYLIGSNAADVILGLLGNDDLSGRGGADELFGGVGNDTARGGSGDDAIYGQENKDSLFGDGGDDYLDGGLSADYMSGGVGDDTYVVDNKGDVVDDKGGVDDVDTVLVPLYLQYTLAKTVEDATLTGNHNGGLAGNGLANDLAGNSGDNALSGGAGTDELDGDAGDDKLNGGTGKDTLTGGNGKDTFIFDKTLGSGNVDSITDYDVPHDRIAIDNSVFVGLTAGKLAAGAFVVGSKAADTGDRIIYDSKDGELWYDKDGTGSGKAVLFATIDAGLKLTAGEFLII